MKRTFTKFLSAVLLGTILLAGTVSAQVERALADGVQSVLFSPDETDVLYLAKGNHIYKSTDKGASWGTDPLYTHPSSAGLINKLAFMPGNNLYLYFSVFSPDFPEDGGLYKYRLSSDETTEVKTGTVVSDFAIDASGKMAIADAVNGENFYSEDGSVFSLVLAGKKLTAITFIVKSGWIGTSTYINGTAAEGMYQTEIQYGQVGPIEMKYGVSEQPYSTLHQYVYEEESWGEIVQYEKYFLGGLDGKLYVNDDLEWPSFFEAAVTWDGSSSEDYPRVIRSHANGDTIWVGEYNELAYSADAGATWRTMLLDNGEHSVMDLTYNPEDNGQVVVACRNALLYSEDTVKTYTALSNVPSPTLFGKLKYFTTVGSTDSYDLGVLDADGVSTVTIEGDAASIFDISSEGVLTLKDGQSLVADTINGKVNVSDGASNTSSADFMIIVMDPSDTEFTTLEFTVREQSDKEYPLEVGISDANGIVSVVFDENGELGTYFNIDLEGNITLKGSMWDISAAIDDTIGGKVIVTDILGTVNEDSVTVFVDAVCKVGVADWNGNIFLAFESGSNDTTALDVTDADGVATISLGGPIAEVFDVSNDGLMTVKEGASLIAGDYYGYVKVTDVLGREYIFSSLKIEVRDAADFVFNKTVYFSHYKWDNYQGFQLDFDAPNGISNAFVYGDGQAPAENDLDLYFTTSVNASSGTVFMRGIYGSGNPHEMIVGMVGLVDYQGDTTLQMITVYIHSNATSINSQPQYVTEEDTAAVLNYYIRDNDGIDTVKLSGNATNYFTTDNAGKLTQIDGTVFDADIMMEIDGQFTVTDDSTELSIFDIVIIVNTATEIPGDSVTVYMLEDTGIQEAIIDVSDGNGLSKVLWDRYYEKNELQEVSYVYLEENAGVVLSTLEGTTLTNGLNGEGRLIVTDNTNTSKHIVVFLEGYNLAINNTALSVREDQFTDFDLGIEPVEIVETIVLTGELETYFEVSLAGVLTLKSGVSLDYFTDSEITGTVVVTDKLAGNEFTEELIITVEEYNTTGIHDLAGINVSIYPNPVSDVLNIKNAEGSMIQLINSIGVVVRNYETVNSHLSIDVSEFEAGLYFVNVIRDNEKEVNRVIILR